MYKILLFLHNNIIAYRKHRRHYIELKKYIYSYALQSKEILKTNF
jgi:hypothetical protein